MTRQIEKANSLVGSSAGNRFSRLNALAAVAILMFGGTLTGWAQQPQAVQQESAKPAA